MTKTRENADYPNREFLDLEASAGNQTVNSTGETTFKGDVTTEKLLESKGGVKVSGGLVSQVETGFSFSNGQLVASNKSHGSESCGLKCIHQGDGSNSSIASSLQISRGGANGSERPDYRGIFIENIKTNNASETVYGIYSQVGSGPGTNYNFYVAGNAPNYFRGQVICGASDDPNAYAPDTGNANGWFGQATGFNIKRSTNDTAPCLYVTRNCTGDADKNGREFIQFNAPDNGGELGKIMQKDGALLYHVTSDYRIKSNIQPLTSAAGLVKNLNPVTYTLNHAPEYTHAGFIAHELQEVAPQAVSGTKDATEAIGTLTDYNGTVLQTEVPEPSAEEMTYTEEIETDGVATMVTRTKTWSATGTRDVYQGVDQTKLIPLLTKALQEALERIEALENA